MTNTVAAGVQLEIGGCVVDLMGWTQALDVIEGRARRAEGGACQPLAVASANLDHIHHFGQRGRSRSEAMKPNGAVDWLTLLDGAPLAVRAKQLTGSAWPRLAGSDLLPSILARAGSSSTTVGFLGGSTTTLQRAVDHLRVGLPELKIAGCWAPTRAQVTDPALAGRLADEVRKAAVDLLVVGLGKPRQEEWIQRYGARTGAGVLLAFGASTDFLAGTARRAPEWVRKTGLEWGYRLGREPRRLWRRYLLQGPSAVLAVARYSTATNPGQCNASPAGSHSAVIQPDRGINGVQ